MKFRRTVLTLTITALIGVGAWHATNPVAAQSGKKGNPTPTPCQCPPTPKPAPKAVAKPSPPAGALPKVAAKQGATPTPKPVPKATPKPPCAIDIVYRRREGVATGVLVVDLSGECAADTGQIAFVDPEDPELGKSWIPLQKNALGKLAVTINHEFWAQSSRPFTITTGQKLWTCHDSTLGGTGTRVGCNGYPAYGTVK